MSALHGSIIVYGEKRSYLEGDPPEKQYRRTRGDAISGIRDRAWETEINGSIVDQLYTISETAASNVRYGVQNSAK